MTALGGLEAVINRKQWVIVCEPFNFPSSFTNKSFVIKKLYVNALHHYEQVYFHRHQGPLVSAPTGPSEGGPIPSHVMPASPAATASPSAGATPNTDSRAQKRKPEGQCESLVQAVTVVPASSNSGSPSAPSVTPVSPWKHSQSFNLFRKGKSEGWPGLHLSPFPPPPSPQDLRAGTRFTGVIDCSFEQGYMITLNLPNQRLQGILYKQAPPAGAFPLQGGSHIGHLPYPHSLQQMQRGGRGRSGGPHGNGEDSALSQELDSRGHLHNDPLKRARGGGPAGVRRRSLAAMRDLEGLLVI